MNSKRKQSLSLILSTVSIGIFILLSLACSRADDTSKHPKQGKNTLTAFVLEAPPADTWSVSQARAQAKPGASIQVSGQIGGTVRPFVEGYAGFVLADPNLEFCSEMGDDHCATPWDACCEDPDKIKSMRITVQFVDSEGRPIEGDLKQSLGIKELDEVIIVGTLAETSTHTNMILNATGLYRF